ncbi:MAG: sigma-70 family RNA polymerase sigma factor [Pirellula sp.]
MKGAKDFLTLFVAHERRLRNFARILVYESHDADEVFQEASVTMIEKFDSLTFDGDFSKWACKIILFKVMELRRKKGREKLRHSDKTVEALASHAEGLLTNLSERSMALEKCIQHLTPTNRSMLLDRYEQGQDIDSIASKFHTSVAAVYRSLSRSRKLLHDCISQSLANQSLANQTPPNA